VELSLAWSRLEAGVHELTRYHVNVITFNDIATLDEAVERESVRMPIDVVDLLQCEGSPRPVLLTELDDPSRRHLCFPVIEGSEEMPTGIDRYVPSVISPSF